MEKEAASPSGLSTANYLNEIAMHLHIIPNFRVQLKPALVDKRILFLLSQSRVG